MAQLHRCAGGSRIARTSWGRVPARVSLSRPRARPGGQEDDQPGPSERSYEELFQDEIARRGLTGGPVTSSREDPSDADPISSTASPGRGPFQQPTPRGAIPGSRSRAPPRGADGPDPASGQRERSIALVNEGLEGLLPRASQLLQLGASVFLAFAPFIVAISLLFSGVYFVFGDSFVHGGQAGKGLPAYIDAEALLAEPTVDPRVPYM